MSPATWTSIGRSVPFIIVAILIDLVWLGAQSVTVTRVTDTLHVRAPEFRFLQGRVLTQLRDGRTARLDVRLELLGRASGPVLAADGTGVQRQLRPVGGAFRRDAARASRRARSRISRRRPPRRGAWRTSRFRCRRFRRIGAVQSGCGWCSRSRDDAPAPADGRGQWVLDPDIDRCAGSPSSAREAQPLVLEAGPFNVN